jgi:hypothetical protein
MRLKHARAILGHHLPPFIPSTRAVARAFLCVPSIIDSLEVRFLYPAKWWRRISEAQGPHREMRSEGSLEQSRGPMDKNRITRPTRPDERGHLCRR